MKRLRIIVCIKVLYKCTIWETGVILTGGVRECEVNVMMSSVLNFEIFPSQCRYKE